MQQLNYPNKPNSDLSKLHVSGYHGDTYTYNTRNLLGNTSLYYRRPYYRYSFNNPRGNNTYPHGYDNGML